MTAQDRQGDGAAHRLAARSAAEISTRPVWRICRLRGSHLALSQRVEADDVLRRVVPIRHNLDLPSIGLP
jgi:hypothetical protein